MKRIESFSGVFLVAGLVFFGGATLSLGFIPAFMVDKVHPRQGLPPKVPEVLQVYFGDDVNKYHDSLMRGRDLYIREACWHCHSQYVRPTANENLYYGPVSTAGEYQTALHLPQLLGTRRVGPDLSRESGKRSNDWHLAHLYQPTSVVPESVMPSFTWYFKKDGEQIIPTDDGIALVAYLQTLGLAHASLHLTAVDADDYVLPPQGDE